MKQGKESTIVEAEDNSGNLSMAQVFGSIFASFYGVQSSKNRRRDFQRGKATQFIVAGLIMTGIWYFTIYLIVSLVLHNTR